MEEAEFKKWAKDHQYRLTKDDLGLYNSTHTQSAWEAWQFRAKLNEQPVTETHNAKD